MRWSRRWRNLHDECVLRERLVAHCAAMGDTLIRASALGFVPRAGKSAERPTTGEQIYRRASSLPAIFKPHLPKGRPLKRTSKSADLHRLRTEQTNSRRRRSRPQILARNRPPHQPGRRHRRRCREAGPASNRPRYRSRRRRSPPRRAPDLRRRRHQRTHRRPRRLRMRPHL